MKQSELANTLWPYIRERVESVATNRGATGSVLTNAEVVAARKGINYATAPVNLATTIRYAAQGVYNVRAYGAVGDGSTDDTTALQAVIDAAEANGRGEIAIPAGTYKITSAITIEGDNIRFRGDNAKILATTAIAMLQLGACDNVIVEGIEFANTVAYASVTNTSNLIRSTGAGATNIHIRNCKFNGGYTAVRPAQGDYRWTVSKCEFTAHLFAGVIAEISDLHILDNYFYSIGEDTDDTTLAANAALGAATVSLTSAANFSIGCAIIIRLNSGTHTTTVTNLVGTTATLADVLPSAANSGNAVARFYIDGHAHHTHPIYWNATTDNTVSGLRVENNIFKDNVGTPVAVASGSPGATIRDVIIRGNTFYNNATYANFANTTTRLRPDVQINELWRRDGTHNGAANAATLTDTTQAWTVNEFVGQPIYNVTDDSSGTITANTATTVTATLAGGSENDWDVGDTYYIDDASTTIRNVHIIDNNHMQAVATTSGSTADWDLKSAVQLAGNCKSVIIRGNVMNPNGGYFSGVLINTYLEAGRRPGRVLVQGNSFYCTTTGVFSPTNSAGIGRAGFNCSDWVIQGNTVFGCNMGVYGTFTNTLIQGNHMQNLGADNTGIYAYILLSAGSLNNVIQANLFVNDDSASYAKYTIRLDSGANNNIVMHNTWDGTWAAFRINDNGTGNHIVKTDGVGVAFGGNPTTIFGKVAIDQDNSAGAIPVLYMDQGDGDEPMFQFVATAAADTTATYSTLTTLGSVVGNLQIKVNGTKRWITVRSNPA